MNIIEWSIWYIIKSVLIGEILYWGSISLQSVVIYWFTYFEKTWMFVK